MDTRAKRQRPQLPLPLPDAPALASGADGVKEGEDLKAVVPCRPQPLERDARPTKLGHAAITYVTSKSLLTPASGFIRSYKFTLNPYSGCAFACEYCYARFFAPTPEEQAEWGAWVKVKTNAVQLLRRARCARSRPRRLEPGDAIYMSSVTDPYQPIEHKLSLTRALLEELIEVQPRLTIQTRSPIATRDVDLFQQFRHIRVNFTITTDSSGDPTYAAHAVPVVYGLHYAVQQVSAVVWALWRLAQHVPLAPQERVLDLGSGLDAVALALEAMDLLAPTHEVVCVEPSAPMRRLAALIDAPARRTHLDGSLERIVEGQCPDGTFTSIFLSSTFQYEHRNEQLYPPEFFLQLATHCLRLLRGEGFLLACGPMAKANALEQLKAAFGQLGGCEVYDLVQSAVLGVTGRTGPAHLARDYPTERLAGLRASLFAAAEPAFLSADATAKMFVDGHTSGAVTRLFTRHYQEQAAFAVLCRPAPSGESVSSYPVIDARDLNALLARIGSVAQVIGRVADVRRSRAQDGGEYAFVNFGDYRLGCLTITIWSPALQEFDAKGMRPEGLRDQWIAVTGYLMEYHNEFGRRPEIELIDPSDIELVDEGEARRRVRAGTVERPQPKRPTWAPPPVAPERRPYELGPALSAAALPKPLQRLSSHRYWVVLTAVAALVAALGIIVFISRSPGATAPPSAAATATAVAAAAPCAPGQIKANRNSQIYHMPGQEFYAATTRNVQCFDTGAAAQAAGYRAARR